MTISEMIGWWLLGCIDRSLLDAEEDCLCVGWFGHYCVMQVLLDASAHVEAWVRQIGATR